MLANVDHVIPLRTLWTMTDAPPTTAHLRGHYAGGGGLLPFFRVLSFTEADSVPLAVAGPAGAISIREPIVVAPIVVPR